MPTATASPPRNRRCRRWPSRVPLPSSARPLPRPPACRLPHPERTEPRRDDGAHWYAGGSSRPPRRSRRRWDPTLPPASTRSGEWNTPATAMRGDDLPRRAGVFRTPRSAHRQRSPRRRPRRPPQNLTPETRKEDFRLRKTTPRRQRRDYVLRPPRPRPIARLPQPGRPSWLPRSFACESPRQPASRAVRPASQALSPSNTSFVMRA